MTSIRRITLAGTFGLVCLAAGSAHASSLTCNKSQTRCLTRLADTTIGEQVGIYDRDGSLVAKGKVSGMKGEQRALKIIERTGKIRSNYRVSLLAKRRARSAEPAMAPWSLGIDAGMIRASSGKGTEASAHVDWQWNDGVYVTTRILRHTYETPVDYPEVLDNRGDVALPAETLPADVTLLGATVGLKVAKRVERQLSLFAEAGGGAGQVSYRVDGDDGLAQPEGSDLPQGLVPVLRLAGGANAHFGPWSLGVSSWVTQIQLTRSFGIGAGVARDLP